MLNYQQSLTHCLYLLKGREKKRLMLSPDSAHDEIDDHGEGSLTQNSSPEDVLVVSLGVVNECPGMLSEHRVC